jgi:hypothetical protein
VVMLAFGTKEFLVRGHRFHQAMDRRASIAYGNDSLPSAEISWAAAKCLPES